MNAGQRILEKQQRLRARAEIQESGEAAELLSLRLEHLRPDDLQSLGRLVDFFQTHAFYAEWLKRLGRQGQALLQARIRGEEAPVEGWLEEVRALLIPVERKEPPPFRDYSPNATHSSLIHRVSERLFRGPQPFERDLVELKGFGLTRVVNLRQESEQSRDYCEKLELGYHYIPVTDQEVPRLDQVHTFLELLRQGGPALVHCWAGQGRTGIFVTCYRIRLGVELEEAIRLSDAEARCRGLRDHQREWVRRHHGEFAP
ncbi:MAG: tyrosine-protein phosphatase [Candidatus Eremiobacterota bacterium]